MKLGDLKSVTLDDSQVKALVLEWLEGDNPAQVPWGRGFFSVTTVFTNHFQPWLASLRRPEIGAINALSQTMLVYRLGHAFETFPLLASTDGKGNVSFNLSWRYVEAWITEGTTVPWNTGWIGSVPVATAFFEWFDKTHPKESAFLRKAYDTKQRIEQYFQNSFVRSQHVSIGRKNRRSYEVSADHINGSYGLEFFSSHDKDDDGRTLFQHWMNSRHEGDVPWAEEINGARLKTLFDAFCVKYFKEEFGSVYHTHYISRESLEEYLYQLQDSPDPNDRFRLVRYKKDGEQKFKFYFPERAELREKYDLVNPPPLGQRMFRAIIDVLEEKPRDLWALCEAVEEYLGVPVSFHEVQYARLKLLDGGLLSNEGRREGVVLWSVKKSVEPVKPVSLPPKAPDVVPEPKPPEPKVVEPPKAPEPKAPEPKQPPVSTAPKAPPTIPAETHQIMSVSEIVRVFKVPRHHVQRVIDKYALKQHTKTRYFVPIALVQEQEQKVKRTAVPSHPIGPKYDAARRTIAADIARAFNKLGTVPSYNGYLAWADRALEFTSKDAFNHYFSDWDAALIVAGVLKAPTKPTLVKPVKPERPTISIAAPKPEPEPVVAPTPVLNLWDDAELLARQRRPKTLAELKAEHPTIDPALVTRMHELSELGRESIPVSRRHPEQWELDRVSNLLAESDDEDEDEIEEAEIVEAEIVPEPAPEVLPVVIEQAKPVVTSEDWFDSTAPFEPIETDTNTFDFLSETIQWNPVDSFSKAVDFDVLRLPNTWEDRQIVKVGDFAGINLLMLGQVLGVMIANPRHMFLIETRDVGYFNKLNDMISWEPNIFLGVKTEFLIDHGPKLQEQLHALEHSQARIRFVHSNLDSHGILNLDLTHVDWVIAGAPYEHHESGEYNLLTLAERCAKRGKAFYFKGWYGPHTLAGKLYREVPA